MKTLSTISSLTDSLSESKLSNISGGRQFWNIYAIGEGIKYASRRRGASYMN